jgi:hypothetical protein
MGGWLGAMLLKAKTMLVGGAVAVLIFPWIAIVPDVVVSYLLSLRKVQPSETLPMP